MNTRLDSFQLGRNVPGLDIAATRGFLSRLILQLRKTVNFYVKSRRYIKNERFITRDSNCIIDSEMNYSLGNGLSIFYVLR